MLSNYLKIAWRSLIKSKVFSFVNILGLGIGMAVAMLVSLWVWDEISFDRGNPNSARVARVMLQSVQNGEIVTSPNMPFPLSATLRKSYPDDFEHVALSWDTSDYDLVVGKNRFRKRGRFMEPDGAEILAPEMLSGKRSSLKDQSSVLISESTAKAMFGENSATGKILTIDGEMKAQIAGVFKDFPNNSQFSDLAFIGPWDLFVSVKKRKWMQEASSNWSIKTFEILVQVAPKTTIESVSGKIKNAMLNRVSDIGTEAVLKPSIILHPMHKWHLFSEWENGLNTGGFITYVRLFSIIGVLVLVLACINFMNLSTARSQKRGREVGVRKAVGSLRSQLIFQFLCESMMMVVFSFALALVFVELVLPAFNAFSDKKIMFLSGNDLAAQPLFWIGSLVICIITAVLAGIYPAFYLSAFKPVRVLQSGSAFSKHSNGFPRRLLVVVQFSLSIILITGTWIVLRQIQFGRDRNVGYERERLVNIRMANFHGPLEALTNELMRSPDIVNVAQSSGMVTDVRSNAGGFSWAGKDPGLHENFAVIAASHDYGKTVGWQVHEGRDFARSFSSDSNAVILNEAAVKYMGIKNPVGKTIRWKDDTFNDDAYHIVGVVKDMVMESPFAPVKQTIYFMTYAPNFLLLKVNPKADFAKTITRVEAVFRNYAPDATLDYKLADQEYQNKFHSEERIASLARLSAILAIFISCLGLFGMVSFLIEQRTKEIGIRKVLGASSLRLWSLLTSDFAGSVLISCLIATPVTWYLMDTWLDHYEYRSSVPWWVFLISCTGSMLIALATVSFQAIKAALMNPVKSLKSD
jgi:putative ABC transport system permease protein